MQTIRSLSKGKKSVALFYHSIKGCTVIMTCEEGQYKRGDVAYDKKGRMICRAVHDPTEGSPVYDLKYAVTSLVLDGEPEDSLEIAEQDAAV